jgi:thiosulfate sulfurtransferase
MSTPIKTLQCEEVPAILESGDVMLLDCRNLTDYRDSHLDGAMHAHDALVENLVRKGDKQKTIVVYCYSGHRSEHLTEFLTGFGFPNVYNMAGGYTRWMELQSQATE